MVWFGELGLKGYGSEILEMVGCEGGKIEEFGQVGEVNSGMR